MNDQPDAYLIDRQSTVVVDGVEMYVLRRVSRGGKYLSTARGRLPVSEEQVYVRPEDLPWSVAHQGSRMLLPVSGARR